MLSPMERGAKNPKTKLLKGFPGKTDINVIKAYSKRTNVKHGPAKMPSTSQGKSKGRLRHQKIQRLTETKNTIRLMPKIYTPKQSYFSELRVQKIAKDVVRDSTQDRKLALEAFDYFKNMVADNPLDDKAKAEMSKALDLAQGANDKVVKILDLMLKMTQAEMKTTKTTDPMSFEDLSK